jgi:CheY-like chemotaxis protein
MILIVEDEPLVMMVCREALETRGYIVLEGSSAKEALERFQNHRTEIELVIADICIPGGSGIQVAAACRAQSPQMPILLTSGYPSTMWADEHSALLDDLRSKNLEVMQKPFLPGALRAKVQKLIGPAKVPPAA